MTPSGTVVKGMPVTSFCIGIRMIVSSQSPSISVRERSSTSAMSSKNDSGTPKVLVRKSKSSASGHSTFTQLFGNHSFLSSRFLHNKDNLSSYCLLSLWPEKRHLRNVSSGVNKLNYTFANWNHPYLSCFLLKTFGRLARR